MQIPHSVGKIPAHIHSAGVDLVDLSRWERAVERCGDALAQRYFTARERRTAQEWATDDRSYAEVLGHLFGVKESVVKAVGGLPPTGRLADICVGNPYDNRDPDVWTVRLSGPLACWADAEQVEVVGSSVRIAGGLALSWAAARTPGAPS